MNTKKLFSLFFILSLFTSLPSWGQATSQSDDQQSCSSSLPFIIETESLWKTNCGNKRKRDKICKCLDEASNSNFLIRSLNEDKSIKEEDVVKVKDGYRDRYLDIYEKMTVGASIQAKILEIDNDLGQESSNGDKDKVVGCTPSEISKKVFEKIAINGKQQKEDLLKLRDKHASDLNECLKDKKSSCKNKENVVNLIDKKIIALDRKMSPCEMSLDLLWKRLTETEVLADMKKRFKGDLANSTMVAGLEATAGKDPQPFYRLLKIMPGVTGSCEQYSKLLSEFNEKYKKKIAETQKNEGDEVLNLPGKQCENGDLLCQQFDDINSKLLNKNNEKFAANPKDCITRSEYATFKAMPGPELLKAMLSTGRPEKFLTIPQTRGELSSLDVERVDFLRSNPIIAKMATNEKYAKALGDKMKAMAKTIENKDQTTKFKEYLNFMQSDVRDLTKQTNRLNGTDAFVCNELINTFTAIEISNDLPELQSKQDFSGDMGALIREVDKCKEHEYNKSSTTDLYSTLNGSPIFNLGVPKVSEANEEEEFKQLNESVCKNYESFAETQCKDKNDKCRKNYLKSLASHSNLDGLSDITNQGFINGFVEGGIIPAIANTDGVKSHLTTTEIEEVGNYFDESKQDHDYKSWWDQNVGSKMSQSVIARAGHLNEFKASRDFNENIASDTEASSNINGSSDLSKTNVDRSSASLSKVQGQPGQQVPDYAKEVPRFDPTKLAGATGPKDLIPNFEKLPLEEKKESLAEVKKFVASQENSPFEAKDVDKELDKVNDEMSKEIAELEKKIEKVKEGNKSSVSQSAGQKSSGTSFSSNTNFTNSSGGNQQSSSPFVSSGGSISASGKISGANKTANAINTHLVATFEERSGIASDAEGRSPASLKGEASINFQKGVVDPTLLQAGLIVSEVVPDSHDEYEKIKGDLDQLKKYLAAQIDPKQIKGAMVYKVKDPMESPDSYILFHVSQASNGAINVKTIDRKSTLKSLNNTLK